VVFEDTERHFDEIQASNAQRATIDAQFNELRKKKIRERRMSEALRGARRARPAF
jgi:hypothetical protein